MQKKNLKIIVALLAYSFLVSGLMSYLSAQVFERPIISKTVLTGMNTFSVSATPTFSSKQRLKAGSLDMRVDTYTSVPCVVDWNGDGNKDLLVGCFFYGNVYLFINYGTNEVPVFSIGTKLKADGNEISVPYG